MRIFNRSIIVPFILFVITFGISMGLQNRLIERWKIFIYNYRDALYLPSSEYIRTITFGFDQFASDFLWLRMIQSFAAGYTQPENAEQMMGYFRVISDLDPHFKHAYSFSMLSVGEEGKRDDLAREIVDKFIETNPHRYEIPKEGAYHAQQFMKDPRAAVYYIDMAALDPNCPSFVTRWRPVILAGAGHFRIAYESKLINTIRQASEQNSHIYEIENRHLVKVGVDWIREQIRERAIIWEQETGISPTLRQLDESGRLKGLESPDWKIIYGLINTYLSAPNPVEAWDDDELALFADQAIKTWDRLPVSPHDIFMEKYPEFRGYVIWPYWEPDHSNYIITKYEALDFTIKGLDNLNLQGQARRKEAGGLCPLTLEEVLGKKDMADSDYPDSDPFGSHWIWDSELCESLSGSVPNIREMELPYF